MSFSEWPFERSVRSAIPSDCPTSALISSTHKENRFKVDTYPIGDSGPFLQHLGLHDLDNVTGNHAIPAIITAASWENFDYVRKFFKRIHWNTYPKLRTVVYDIGLNETQRDLICVNYTCKYRRFPIRQYPVHLEKIPKHAWKPLIIQAALQEFSFVIWMDSAVYLHNGDLMSGIERARAHGIAAGYKRVTFPEVNLAYETDRMTFESLDEEPCAFMDSYKFNAALIFIRKTKFTYRFIMRPWVSCALTESCIATFRESNSKCLGADSYGYCHRFDQSVLSIILNRLFYDNIETIDLGDGVKWTKCYEQYDDMVFNEMVFHNQTKDLIPCPR